jgi:hypothetical protein
MVIRPDEEYQGGMASAQFSKTGQISHHFAGREARRFHFAQK